jgi:TonB family protein
MKNLLRLLPFILLILIVGLACKNPFAKLTKQYSCVVTGETEPRTADDFIERSRHHFDRKEYQCYFDACSEAVRLDSKNAKAYSCRGSGYFFYQKDYDKAIADQTKAIELDPNNRMYYSRRAAAYEENKLFDEALKDLEKSLELSETDRQKGFTLESMANVLYEKNDLDAALARVDEAVKLNPDDHWNFYTRAKIYKKLGKNDLAAADERKAKELDTGGKDKTASKGSENSEITNSNQTNNSNQTISTPNSISGGVLNGKATNLPKPAYPPSAKAVKASGAVNVQVEVDEKGNVTTAKALSGHPLLRASAEQAARQAKFNPTLLSGKPVKVSGVLVYNFTAE